MGGPVTSILVDPVLKYSGLADRDDKSSSVGDAEQFLAKRNMLLTLHRYAVGVSAGCNITQIRSPNHHLPLVPKLYLEGDDVLGASTGFCRCQCPTLRVEQPLA